MNAIKQGAKAKRSRQEAPALTPAESLDWLAAVMNEMQRSGILVSAGNTDTGNLWIRVEGVQLLEDAEGHKLVFTNTITNIGNTTNTDLPIREAGSE